MTDRLGDFIQDAAALIGACLIIYGADLIYRPAGFVVAGGFLLGAAWWSARNSAIADTPGPAPEEEA